MASSLDFDNLFETYDRLGWMYGTVKAEEAHINWVNFEIANTGPDDAFEDCKKFWLGDLSEQKKETEEKEEREEREARAMTNGESCW